MTGFADQFSITDEAIGPQPWMQLRLVATEEAESVARSYDTSGGVNKADLFQTVQVSWTNDTPVSQQVYGLVTKGGSQVTLQARSRGYLSMGHAVDFTTGETEPTFDIHEVSRIGVGSDIGNGGILALGGAFGISELRQNSVTMPFMPHFTGWWILDPGDTIHGYITVAFISENWESTAIDGGDSDTESTVIAGDVRLDLFALPTPTPAPVAAIPTIVGQVTHDIEIDLIIADPQPSVYLPAGLVEGDTLIAVICNQLGFAFEMYPVQDGWTLIHERDAGWQDVHMKIYTRTVSDSEPATYEFHNTTFAEEIAMLIGVRNATPYDPALRNWHVASNLDRWKLVEDQIAPSIDRKGQLLLAVSYFNYLNLNIVGGITQTPPEGMTELADAYGVASTMAVASLASPPRPTEDRQFTPSDPPLFHGHSITASILIPGVLS